MGKIYSLFWVCISILFIMYLFCFLYDRISIIIVNIHKKYLSELKKQNIRFVYKVYNRQIITKLISVLYILHSLCKISIFSSFWDASMKREYFLHSIRSIFFEKGSINNDQILLIRIHEKYAKKNMIMLLFFHIKAWK